MFLTEKGKGGGGGQTNKKKQWQSESIKPGDNAEAADAQKLLESWCNCADLLLRSPLGDYFPRIEGRAKCSLMNVFILLGRTLFPGHHDLTTLTHSHTHTYTHGRTPAMMISS